MSKKYYWPTLWENLGVILTNGYIAPENVYSQMLPEGVNINIEKYSQTRSTITIFGNLPDVIIESDGSHISDPVIIEINDEVIDPTKLYPIDENAKAYIYLQPIFFNSSNIRVIFDSIQAKNRSEARLSSAAELKNLSAYLKGFSVNSKPNKLNKITNLHGLFTGADLKYYDSEYLVKKIRLIDSIQGTYMGILTGLFFQKSNSERDINGLIQEIKNKYAGAKSDQIMQGDYRSVQNNSRLSYDSGNYSDLVELINRLSDQIERWEFGNHTMASLLDLCLRVRLSKHYTDKLDMQIKKHLTEYKKIWSVSKLQESAIAYFFRNPVEWLFADNLIQAPYLLEEAKVFVGPEWIEKEREKAIEKMKMEPVFIVYKLKSMVSRQSGNLFSRDSEIEFNSMLENLQLFVDNSFNKEKESKLKSKDYRNFELVALNTPVGDYMPNIEWLQENEREYKAWQLVMTELHKEASTRTNIGIKNKGWQYEERIEFINKVLHTFESLRGYDSYLTDLRALKSSLESHFEGSVKIDSIHSAVIANLYAFLFKFKDLDQLDRYLNQKLVNCSYYAWGFWAAFHGYSALPKKYIDPLFGCWNKKELDEVDKHLNHVSAQIL